MTLMREAEAELARLRKQRAELDRAERLSAEKVAHLRALVDLDVGPPGARVDGWAAGELTVLELAGEDGRPQREGPASQTTTSDMRPEDIAAAVLSERGPLHYRELWEEVAQRGGNIVSGTRRLCCSRGFPAMTASRGTEDAAHIG